MGARSIRGDGTCAGTAVPMSSGRLRHNDPTSPDRLRPQADPLLAAKSHSDMVKTEKGVRTSWCGGGTGSAGTGDFNGDTGLTEERLR